jgi:MoaA/NifB/PqqE/SkfB family radical SAM enzyme
MLVSDEVDSGNGSGTLMLHLLGRCNLRCAHCYMDGAPDRVERLAVDHVLEAIGECAKIGISSLYVTGGEPLLYPDIDRVLAAGAAVGGMTTTLCTNATRLTEAFARRLAELDVRLNISIDGDPVYHDAFRKRRGAFATAQRGLDRAVAAGCKVTIISTITQRNLEMVPALVGWAIAHGATTFRAQPLLKLGRGVAIGDERLTSAQLDFLILTLTDLANRHRAEIKCSIIGQSRRFLEAHPCAAYVCNGGGCHRRIEKEIKKIVVRENGVILPESTNLDRAYRIGMLGDAPLSEMIESYLNEGYARFDRLCRTAYGEIIPGWTMAIVPWDQIVAERSRSTVPERSVGAAVPCGARVAFQPPEALRTA